MAILKANHVYMKHNMTQLCVTLLKIFLISHNFYVNQGENSKIMFKKKDEIEHMHSVALCSAAHPIVPRRQA